MIIITLTKNSSKTILDTIKSLENQSLKDIFWMILDDQSTDNTISLIKNSKIKHEIININTKGLFFAYNVALNILRERKLEDIIFFLHSDDIIYEKETLQNVENKFKEQNISSLIGNIVYFRDNQYKFFRIWKSDFSLKQTKISEKLYKFSKFSKKDLLFGWSFPHTSFFFHSRILQYIPKYDDNFKTSSDYGWSVEILLQNKFEIFYFDQFLIKMKSGGTSTTFSNFLKQIISDFKIIKKIFFRNFLDIFVCCFILFFKKFRKIKQFF